MWVKPGLEMYQQPGPSGFWLISKVISRHPVWEERAKGLAGVDTAAVEQQAGVGGGVLRGGQLDLP